jgi:hypothetical protein
MDSRSRAAARFAIMKQRLMPALASATEFGERLPAHLDRPEETTGIMAEGSAHMGTR